MTALPDKITLADGTVLPVITPDKAEETDISKALKQVASAMGKEAVEEAFKLGLPVTVGKGDKIIRLYPDGHEEIVGELPGKC